MSKLLTGNAVVGQSGGPTCVINQSLVGVIEEFTARASGKLFGMRHGVAGLEKERLIELKAEEQAVEEDAWDPEVTRELAKRIRDIEAENESFRRMRRTTVIGRSPAWLRTLRDTAIRARDRDPVVILGPTGSGKTGIAHAVHAIGPRQEKPFGEFNCAEFASGDPLIVLGKLFGYGVGSGIAGIDPKGQKGVLEEYDGGTLFLDEAELLPLQAQQLLLLPLEGRPFNPAAGKGEPRTVNVRFILATNVPLEELVHGGRMRIDLLRRIQARGVVRVPPLAKRPEDIEPLAAYFLARRNAVSERQLAVAPEVLAAFSRYGFDRYNVSELAGAVNQAFDSAFFEEAPRIELAHVSRDILFAVEGGPEVAAAPAPSCFDGDEERELAALRAHDFNITRAEAELGYAAGSKTLTHHLRGIVYRALDHTGWDGAAAADAIAGPASDIATRDRLREKVVDYIAAAQRHVDAGTSEALFAKLPQKYFPVLERFLDALRRSAVRES